MRVWREAWQLMRRHWRLLIAVNIAFFVVVVLGAALTMQNPVLDTWFSGELRQARQWGIVQWALVWWGKNFFATVAAIAAVNFFVGSLFYLTLPSLAVPGAALPLILFRAFVWGIISTDWAVHREYSGLLLIVLEGEAYVLATIAAILHARAWLFPQRVGASSHREAYRIGLQQNLVLQILVAAELVIAALYEAVLIVIGRT